MPKMLISPYGHIHYTVDDFIRPWDKADTVACVHGFSESSLAWNPWVPYLAKRNKVVRHDQRGFGQSSPMPEDFPWSLDVLADDLIRLIETAATGPIHVIGAKIGGPVTIRAAAKRPDLVKSLTLCSTPIKGPNGVPVGKLMREQGMRTYAETTMGPRMQGMSQAAVDWWTDLMSSTAPSTAIGFMNNVSKIDVEADLPNLKCPVLIITVDSPKRPIDQTKAWQAKIANTELVVLQTDAYHLAVTKADQCAKMTAAFIAKYSG
jgi:pimeloyl-ACP methyl ester carboxylesterase